VEEKKMIQALMGKHWRKVEILARRKHGVMIVWRDKEIFKQFHHIRWISDDWYVVKRRQIA